MGLLNMYIDPLTFRRAPSGLESDSLLGNLVLLASPGVTAGATSLPLQAPGLTTTLNLYDRVYLFDGPNSEVVTVTVSTDTLGVENISCTPTAVAHLALTVICTNGSLGSLADQIASASAWMEHVCYQSLFQTTYTNELLAMPTMRAAFDADGQLTFRPRHFPITSVTGLAVAWAPSLVVTYDPTQTFIDGASRVCSVPNLVMLPGNQIQNSNLLQSPSRSRKGQVQVTYTAGYAANALPGDLREACVLVTSDLLAKRYNPVGAPDISDGSSHISSVLKGDNSGETMLIKRARAILAKYSVNLY